MRSVQNNSAARARPAGFTLVELLVVVGIIALLVTILMPSLSRALELTRRTICATNLGDFGRAWHMYFGDSDYRSPNMFNLRATTADTSSMFNFLMWTAQGNDFCNAGVLYKAKLIASEMTYVCPTVRKASGGNWFHSDRGSFHNRFVNNWPPVDGLHTTMTYGRRRMTYYDKDESHLAVQQYRGWPDDDDIMLWSAGMNVVARPGDFSYMSDNFHRPDIAMLSHVPGINVMYLDGHVDFYEDTDRNVLYNNGIPVGGWGVQYNWTLDDVWMIIDTYHRPPAGQGL